MINHYRDPTKTSQSKIKSKLLSLSTILICPTTLSWLLLVHTYTHTYAYAYHTAGFFEEANFHVSIDICENVTLKIFTKTFYHYVSALNDL